MVLQNLRVSFSMNSAFMWWLAMPCTLIPSQMLIMTSMISKTIWNVGLYDFSTLHQSISDDLRASRSLQQVFRSVAGAHVLSLIQGCGFLMQFIMQCQLRGRRSWAFSVGFQPSPLCAEIFWGDSLNLLMILWIVHGVVLRNICKCLRWLCSEILAYLSLTKGEV